MKRSTALPAITSILMALDDASSDRDALETAAGLAAVLEAELQGMYLEDDSLLRMAGLPFAQEITATSGVARPIDAQSMQRAMQKKVEQMRAIVARTAENAHIRWSFTTTRDRVAQRSWLTTSEAGIVFFGSRSHAPAVRPPRGMHRRPPTRPIVAVQDTSTASPRVLETALVVAERSARAMVVVVCAGNLEEFLRLARQSRDRLQRLAVPATVVADPVNDLPSLILAARTHRAGLLLLSRDSQLLNDTTVEALVENVDCSIVLA